MELNDYQQKAMTTCLPTCENFSYMMLNLVGEVGELASKVAKAIRKGQGSIEYDKFVSECGKERLSSEDLANLRKEAGDILWQLSGLCYIMGWSLDYVASENLAKLQSRQQRHVIDGDGDNR